MPANKLTSYLDEHNVQYEVIMHPAAYTAQEIAASSHIPGSQIAKTVMIKMDGKLAMVVVPASERVNFGQLRGHTGVEKIELASEKDFKDKFPDCELGAMPPFGNLYGMPVYAADSLSREIEIAFCGGAHGELIRMSFEDFKRLAEPTVLDISWKE